MHRPLSGETALIPGPAGHIETLIDIPADARGIALVCHPHPLFGGANTNKVVHTLARSFRELGYVALRPNFRGVGRSAGEHDYGEGELEDMHAVLRWAQGRWGANLPWAQGGFSFGAYVQTRLAARLAASGQPPRHIVLVGTAVGMAAGSSQQYDTPAIADGVPALIIHGEADETVPLSSVLDWARPQSLPVIVIPGADHFFHGKLSLIRDLIRRNVAPAAPHPAG